MFDTDASAYPYKMDNFMIASLKKVSDEEMKSLKDI